jgi:hypothetical protein
MINPITKLKKRARPVIMSGTVTGDLVAKCMGGVEEPETRIHLPQE